MKLIALHSHIMSLAIAAGLLRFLAIRRKVENVVEILQKKTAFAE
jgi:hypothetical protein